VLWCACSLLAGCGGKPGEEDPTTLRFKKLGRLTGRYLGQNRGASPKNADDLKKFARSLSADELKGLQIDPAEIDDLAVSPRDQQPVVFRTLPKSATTGPPGVGGKVVLAYEKEGSGGKRYVIYLMPPGHAEEVADDAFKELVPEAK
jgi:hypothetical protein